ncbi:MAG: hypothetical protein MJZ47_05505 [Bacteroidales bacterium]|nr:hypothetical protein [Bacteroidales bacterium]
MKNNSAMASIVTLTVDLRSARARSFADYARTLDFVTVEEKETDPLVKEIARTYAGVKNGKIKTQPIENLLGEL